METNWFDEFRGQHITVVTLAGSEEKSDTGTLLRGADGWIQMVKDNGEMILVPSKAIRIVKLLDMTQRTMAVDRPLNMELPTREFISDDLHTRSHAPDDAAVI